MVIDGKAVVTGSFNFTKAAEESNAEKRLVIRSPEIAARFEKNYQEHRAHPVKVEQKEQDSFSRTGEAGSMTRNLLLALLVVLLVAAIWRARTVAGTSELAVEVERQNVRVPQAQCEAVSKALGATASAAWELSIQDTGAPWAAVVVPDNDQAARKEIFGTLSDVVPLE